MDLGVSFPQIPLQWATIQREGVAFQGMIRIRLNSDNNRCVLIFFNERGEQVRKIWDIPLESLISVLDRNIDGVDGDWWQAFKKQYVLNQVAK